MKKVIYVLHPIIFAILPVFVLFNYNIGDIPAAQIILPTIILSIMSVTLLVFTGFILKNYRLGALILSPIIILLLTYGWLYDCVRTFVSPSIAGFIEIILSILIVIGLSVFFYVLFKNRFKKHFIISNKIFSLVALILLLYNLVQIAVYYFNDPKNDLAVCGQYKWAKNEKIGTYPDVYYLILDEYASLEQIKEEYHYDNSAFASRLIAKGFYIATKSKTKYVRTHMSLAESLNMGIPEDNVQPVSSSSLDRSISSSIAFEDPVSLKYQAMIRNNRVLQIFKCMGYEYIHFGSWFFPTRYNKYADKNVNYARLLVKNELNALLIDRSIIRILFINRFYGLPLLRRGMLYAFDELSKIPNAKGPKFIFAHMIIPHGPFGFDENGSAVPRRKATDVTDKSVYLGQYIFTTKKIEKLIEDILTKSKRPPIIIVQSDHGSRYVENGKFKIFNAYYLPDGGNKIINDEIMPGETFRKIFLYYYGLKV